MRSLPFLFFIFLFIPFAGLPAQNAPNAGQIAWYKQTAVVDQNKKRSNGDNTGQFISFTKMGCYDSDDKGYDIGNGFLEYKGSENNIHSYYGKTYWGQGGYFFNNDFSRLNIQTDSGIVYVYEKTSAPAGVVTSAKIRKPDTVVNTTPPVVTPSYTPPSSSGNLSQTSNGSRAQEICPLCHGNKKCNYRNMYGVSYDYCQGGYTGCGKCSAKGVVNGKTCSVCNGTKLVKCTICHGTGICSRCGGKGYI